MPVDVQQFLKRTDNGTFIALAVLGSIVITTLMNSIASLILWGGISAELLIIGTVDAIVVPAVVAPIIIKLLKRSIDLADLNRQLQQEMLERQRAEYSAQQRAANLQAISDLAVECAAASPETDLAGLIAEKLRSITGAVAVSLSTYEARDHTTTVRHLAVSGQILSTANRLLGGNFVGLSIPVSPELLNQMLVDRFTVLDDLTEMSLGAVPRPIAAAIQKTFDISRYIGLSLCYGNELWGTAAIALQAGQPALERELALALASVAAVALRRQKAEEALRQANWIVQSSPVMFFRWKADEQWSVELVSENIAQLGYSAQELISRSMSYTTLVHPADASRVVREIQVRSASGVDRFEQEYRLMTRDGAVRWVDGRTVGERDAAGHITHYQGIVIDMTERKLAATEREKLIAQLAAKNTELEQFTYTVSHDLRSPLISIRGFLGFLEADVVADNVDGVKADVARIMAATDKMQRLLGDLLELSRVGRLMNPPQDVPFDSIVREAVELVSGRLSSRGVIVTIANNLPTVHVDRVRLVQVVQNLVDNAAKYMGDQPQPQIQIGSTLIEQTGETVFFVRDNGLGIEPQYHERIFRLFSKLDAQSEGTGAGLALVKRIVEVHGGRIWVESAGQGQGSTFCFTLGPAVSKSDIAGL
jgi:PAS domain S-box-containing protein